MKASQAKIYGVLRSCRGNLPQTEKPVIQLPLSQDY